MSSPVAGFPDELQDEITSYMSCRTLKSLRLVVSPRSTWHSAFVREVLAYIRTPAKALSKTRPLFRELVINIDDNLTSALAELSPTAWASVRDCRFSSTSLPEDPALQLDNLHEAWSRLTNCLAVTLDFEQPYRSKGPSRVPTPLPLFEWAATLPQEIRLSGWLYVQEYMIGWPRITEEEKQEVTPVDLLLQSFRSRNFEILDMNRPMQLRMGQPTSPCFPIHTASFVGRVDISDGWPLAAPVGNYMDLNLINSVDLDCSHYPANWVAFLLLLSELSDAPHLKELALRSRSGISNLSAALSPAYHFSLPALQELRLDDTYYLLLLRISAPALLTLRLTLPNDTTPMSFEQTVLDGSFPQLQRMTLLSDHWTELDWKQIFHKVNGSGIDLTIQASLHVVDRWREDRRHLPETASIKVVEGDLETVQVNFPLPPDHQPNQYSHICAPKLWSMHLSYDYYDYPISHQSNREARLLLTSSPQDGLACISDPLGCISRSRNAPFLRRHVVRVEAKGAGYYGEIGGSMYPPGCRARAPPRSVEGER